MYPILPSTAMRWNTIEASSDLKTYVRWEYGTTDPAWLLAGVVRQRRNRRILGRIVASFRGGFARPEAVQ